MVRIEIGWCDSNLPSNGSFAVICYSADIQRLEDIK